VARQTQTKPKLAKKFHKVKREHINNSEKNIEEHNVAIFALKSVTGMFLQLPWQRVIFATGTMVDVFPRSWGHGAAVMSDQRV
jgi:hypothetical protein